MKETMNTEQVPTVEETQNPPTEPITPEVAPEAPDDAGLETKSEDVEDIDPKVLQEKLKTLERELRKAQRNNAKLHAKLENKPATAPSPDQKEVDIDLLAEYKAAVKVYQVEANAIVAEGKKLNPKFMDVVNTVSEEVGGLVDQNQLPTTFMKVATAVFKTPQERAKLLDYLGRNDDELSEVAGLGEYELAAKFKEIERNLNKPTSKPSAAPEALKPPKASSASGPRPDGSYEEFLKWREPFTRRR